MNETDLRVFQLTKEFKELARQVKCDDHQYTNYFSTLEDVLATNNFAIIRLFAKICKPEKLDWTTRDAKEHPINQVLQNSIKFGYLDDRCKDAVSAKADLIDSEATADIIEFLYNLFDCTAGIERVREVRQSWSLPKVSNWESLNSLWYTRKYKTISFKLTRKEDLPDFLKNL
jgi:hypothetical protein